LAHHDRIVATHVVPTVVPGWVGVFAVLMFRRSGGVFAVWIPGFVATMIRAIQMRFFAVAYLT